MSGGDEPVYKCPTFEQIKRDSYTRVVDLMDDVYRAPVFSNVKRFHTIQSQLGKPKIKQPLNIKPAPTVTQPRILNYSSPPSSEKIFKWVAYLTEMVRSTRLFEEVTPPPRQPAQPKARLVVPGQYHHFEDKRRSVSTPVRQGSLSPKRTYGRR